MYKPRKNGLRYSLGCINIRQGLNRFWARIEQSDFWIIRLLDYVSRIVLYKTDF